MSLAIEIECNYLGLSKVYLIVHLIDHMKDETPADLNDDSVMDTIKLIKRMNKRNYQVAVSAFDSNWPLKLLGSCLEYNILFRQLQSL